MISKGTQGMFANLLVLVIGLGVLMTATLVCVLIYEGIVKIFKRSDKVTKDRG